MTLNEYTDKIAQFDAPAAQDMRDLQHLDTRHWYSTRAAALFLGHSDSERVKSALSRIHFVNRDAVEWGGDGDDTFRILINLESEFDL